jgi:CelD/BcsL family acetyltransferase involved in cellulose biosynthesis
LRVASTSGKAVEIVRLSTLSEFAALRDGWNTLTGDVPFRRWEWLNSWWRCYGDPDADVYRRELLVLAVFADGHLIGGAPWYMEASATLGNVIRFLGDGEACSEYLGVLCVPGQEEAVATALAEVLAGAQRPVDGFAPPLVQEWDLLELNSVYERDVAVRRLLEKVAGVGFLVHGSHGPACWRIDLPATWAEYLASLSRSHRKQLLRIQRRYFDSGRARLVLADGGDEVYRGLKILAELHQRRWETLKQPGCFSRPCFATFLFDVAYQQMRAGQLQLHWLEFDGEPIAAEYHIVDGGVVYAYQSGIDPRSLRHEPGRMITLALLKRAIEDGRTAFDFLRGDEFYKSHWRAQARPTSVFRVVPGHRRARLRHSLWLAGGSVKKWLKTGLGMNAAAALHGIAGSQEAASLHEATSLQNTPRETNT